jgi:hypothetical protein
MSNLLSDRVRKIPSVEADPERYDFLSLENAEPDLGVPPTDGYVLKSLADGTRYWDDDLSVNSDDSLNGDGTVENPFSVAKLANPVDISLSGEVSGTVSFDGSQNVEIVTSVTSIITLTKTLTLTTEWQDVGVSGTDLTNGTYAIQLFANDNSSGGESIKEYHSGIMSWFSETITEAIELPNDEIILHRAGGGGSGIIYLRTYRSDVDDTLKLQISASYDSASSSNYVFKIRKII